jgi:APA family basic amino acid/polyamine antiporter
MVELKKTLGMGTIIALTLTSLVGTGMFFSAAIGAKYSGNAVLLAWVLLLVLGLYVAACFGELIALFPKSGGVYEFSKQAYGRFFSFLIGWITWLMSTIGISVLIIAALDFIPFALSQDIKIVVAIILIILINFIAYLGVDISATVLIFFAIETIALFVAIIVPGFFKIDYNNFVPLVSGNPKWIFISLFFMLESLMGWEAASFLAEETKNAEKVIPKALMITTVLAGLLGLLFAFVSLGVIPWSSLINSDVPVLSVSNIIFGSQGSVIISLGVLFVLLGSVTGAVISTPRLLLAMARDKLFISQFAAIHPLRQTPHRAILFQTFVSIMIIIMGGFGNYERILSMFTPLALIMSIAVLLAVPILRFKLKSVVRVFKVPFGVVGPVLVSLIYAGVIYAWLYMQPSAQGLFRIVLSLISFGIPIYILLNFFYNSDAISSFANGSSRLSLWFEDLFLPRRIRKKIIGLFGDLKNKSILEYGAGVGTLTLHLAEAVGSEGKIYASDLSHRNLFFLKRRLVKRKISHVEIIHDEHQVNRIHPSVRSVDFIFSVGVMSYMQDVKKVLREMHRILPDSGRICFVEYVNFFKFIPDKEWLTDEDKLHQLFREIGFSVKIEKKKGLFWNYLFVYGIKSDKDVPYI